MRPRPSAIVLAGGSSRRMGRDKLSIPVAGRPMLTIAVRLAAEVADDVVVACRRGSPPDATLFDAVPVRLVFDRREGGPLAGIEAGLAATANDLAVVLAADMPAVSGEMLRQLVDAAVERPGAHGAVFGDAPGLMVFPCALRRTALAVISEQLDRASLRVEDALQRLDLAVVPQTRGVRAGGPLAFANVNLPGDLAAVDPGVGRDDAPAAEPWPREPRTREPRPQEPRLQEPQQQEERRMDLKSCLAAARESLGSAGAKPVAPTAEETAALLDFTRAVAHASERKDAPLAAYAMGVAMANLRPSERAGVLGRAAAAIDLAAGPSEQ